PRARFEFRCRLDPRRPARTGTLGAPEEPSPQRRPSRLGAQPLIAQHELPTRAGGEHAIGVGVAPAAGIAFGRDQHMLAEGAQMMTTKRTAIGRRLAVRRWANRPPWRGRKLGHGPIVAPFTATVAATLAATVAVGVGVALARAE